MTGSVEVAPRLGLADAIVDLVSSGSTLRTNGLRSLGSLFSSEAVLVGARGGDGRARQLAAILAASSTRARPLPDAQRARGRARRDLRGSFPGSRSPSVLPLAEPGMVAVHALVPAADVWHLLPRSRRRRSSILLVPVERMVG